MADTVSITDEGKIRDRIMAREVSVTDRDTLPMPGAPSAAPHCFILLLGPLVPTTSESGRYRAINLSMVSVTAPAMNSTIIDSYRKHISRRLMLQESEE